LEVKNIELNLIDPHLFVFCTLNGVYFVLNLSLLIANADVLFLPCDGADAVQAGL
jgi:hypothetical protein